MKLLVDMNLSPRWAAELRSAGAESIHTGGTSARRVRATGKCLASALPTVTYSSLIQMNRNLAIQILAGLDEIAAWRRGEKKLRVLAVAKPRRVTVKVIRDELEPRAVHAAYKATLRARASGNKVFRAGPRQRTSRAA